MPAARLVPLVTEQVREGLALSLAEGLSFDDAWELTVGQSCTTSPERRLQREAGARFVVMPHKTAERQAWREALEHTMPEWRAAYEGTQTPLSAALDALERAMDSSSYASPAAAALPRGIVVSLAEGITSARSKPRADFSYSRRDSIAAGFRGAIVRRALLEHEDEPVEMVA